MDYRKILTHLQFYKLLAIHSSVCNRNKDMLVFLSSESNTGAILPSLYVCFVNAVRYTTFW
ncbi:hypothetical protein CW304_21420 [Bacillus sp. UFRGS-B20]|nr:hypothetical protein CW304_21420 [Bacillus sp. UFRGS-B20]